MTQILTPHDILSEDISGETLALLGLHKMALIEDAGCSPSQADALIKTILALHEMADASPVPLTTLGRIDVARPRHGHGAGGYQPKR